MAGPDLPDPPNPPNPPTAAGRSTIRTPDRRRQVRLHRISLDVRQVEDVVSILKEDSLAAVAALGNVVGDAFQNNAGDS